nr:PREDICTED: nuclear factor 7, ovary-like [Latimeria chalumnae]|eukprot:XP_014349710.1 PREDICTED: nuclear factor 7, ovary-like [Latimeria chalumnae]
MLETAEKRKKELLSSTCNLLQQIKTIEHTLLNLQECLRLKDSAASAKKEKTTTVYCKVKNLLKTLQRKTLDVIDIKAEGVVDKVTSQFSKLETKEDNILHKMQEIRFLRDISDPMDFLKESKCMVVNAEEEDEEDSDGTNGSGNNDDIVEEETKGLIKENLDEQTTSLLKDTMNGFTETLYILQVKYGLVLQDSYLSFDASTVHKKVILSDFLKKATNIDNKQRYSENAKRFCTFCQVMSSEDFSSGRHFWELEVSAKGDWSVGLAYNSIERDGEVSAIGENSVSWCLDYIDNNLSALFNCNITALKRETEAPQKVGMYLDYEAGVLSFYDLADTLTHLHTFTCTFTEPVYLLCYVFNSGWVKIRP